MSYTIIQEELKAEGSKYWRFWLLVACILVNRARGEKARPILATLREWSIDDPFMLTNVKPEKIYSIVSALGFGNTRTKRIIELATLWRSMHVDGLTCLDILDLPGCGEFAADTWAIFVEERRDIKPDDKELKAYLARQSSGNQHERTT